MQVIEAQNLSKQYTLGSRQPYSLREMLTGLFDRSDGSNRNRVNRTTQLVTLCSA